MSSQYIIHNAHAYVYCFASYEGTSENLEPIEIDNYRLPPVYSTLLAQLKPAYYAKRMPVRDSSKEIVAFDKHADYMTDALVQVSFALKFYTARGLVAETLSVNVLD